MATTKKCNFNASSFHFWRWSIAILIIKYHQRSLSCQKWSWPKWLMGNVRDPLLHSYSPPPPPSSSSSSSKSLSLPSSSRSSSSSPSTSASKSSFACHSYCLSTFLHFPVGKNISPKMHFNCFAISDICIKWPEQSTNYFIISVWVIIKSKISKIFPPSIQNATFEDLQMTRNQVKYCD